MRAEVGHDDPFRVSDQVVVSIHRPSICDEMVVHAPRLRTLISRVLSTSTVAPLDSTAMIARNSSSASV
jgi:hypothetical protein